MEGIMEGRGGRRGGGVVVSATAQFTIRYYYLNTMLIDQYGLL